MIDSEGFTDYTARVDEAAIVAALEGSGTLVLTSGKVCFSEPTSGSIILNGGELIVETTVGEETVQTTCFYETNGDVDDGMTISLDGKTISGLSKDEGGKNHLADSTEPDKDIADFSALTWKQMVAPDSDGVIDLSTVEAGDCVVVDSLTAPTKIIGTANLTVDATTNAKTYIVDYTTKVKLPAGALTINGATFNGTDVITVDATATKVDEQTTLDATLFAGTITIDASKAETTLDATNEGITVVKGSTIDATAVDGKFTALGALVNGETVYTIYTKVTDGSINLSSLTESGEGIITLTGIGSIDGLSIANNVVTVGSASLGQKDITLGGDSKYTLALGSDVPTNAHTADENDAYEPIRLSADNMTISKDGIYKFADAFTGTVTIGSSVKNVKLIGANETLTNAFINASATTNLNLWIENVNINATEDEMWAAG